MSELSAADVAAALAIAKKYQDALTEEQRNKNKELRAAAMGTEEAKAETMTKMQELFGACDADGDGRLNYDEFKAFTKGIADSMVAKGGTINEMEEDDKRALYDIHNKSSADEGVTGAEFMANTMQLREAAKAGQ